MARVYDNGEDFKRLDFAVEEVSSTAQWVLDAKEFNERKRLRESPQAILERLQSSKKGKNKVEELSPAEASRVDGIHPHSYPNQFKCCGLVLPIYYLLIRWVVQHSNMILKYTATSQPKDRM